MNALEIAPAGVAAMALMAAVDLSWQQIPTATHRPALLCGKPTRMVVIQAQARFADQHGCGDQSLRRLLSMLNRFMELTTLFLYLLDVYVRWALILSLLVCTCKELLSQRLALLLLFFSFWLTNDISCFEITTGSYNLVLLKRTVSLPVD